MVRLKGFLTVSDTFDKKKFWLSVSQTCRILFWTS